MESVPGLTCRNHTCCLCAGGAYDLLSELLQPAGGGGARDEGGGGFGLTSQSGQLVLLRRRLERTEQQVVSDTNTLSSNQLLRHHLNASTQSRHWNKDLNVLKVRKGFQEDQNWFLRQETRSEGSQWDQEPVSKRFWSVG